MAIVRGASASNKFQKCYQYDIQFRLRMSINSSRLWSNIDGHLWLTCGLLGDNPSTSDEVNRNASAGACYDYNFKGGCYKMFCQYRHTCIVCKLPHPSNTCVNAQKSMRFNSSASGAQFVPRPRFVPLGSTNVPPSGTNNVFQTRHVNTFQRPRGFRPISPSYSQSAFRPQFMGQR